MENMLYGIPTEQYRWKYRGFTITESDDLILVVQSPEGKIIEELNQEFTYNLWAYRLGALNTIHKKIDHYLANVS